METSYHDIFVSVCLHIFTLFWLKKTSGIIETYQLSFYAFLGAFHREISYVIGKIFLFLFLCFC